MPKAVSTYPRNAAGHRPSRALPRQTRDVPPEQVVAFGKEMSDAGVDWQLHAYGGVLHAFTVPDANDPKLGTLYDARAARRSWCALLDFYEEIFA